MTTKNKKAQEDTPTRAAIAAAKVFGTEDGKFLLDFIEKTYERAPNIPNAPDGVSMAIFMGINEGQRNLIRVLRALIKKGQGK